MSGCIDFRAVRDVTHDLGNYADVIHHSPAVDLKVLSWLAAGKYVVDRAAPTASLDRLKAQVEAYRVDKFHAVADLILRSRALRLDG